MSAEAELASTNAAQQAETFITEETFDDNEKRGDVEKQDAEKDESAEIELIKASEGWVFPKVKVCYYLVAGC